jgi:hypothetical protein
MFFLNDCNFAETLSVVFGQDAITKTHFKITKLLLNTKKF